MLHSLAGFYTSSGGKWVRLRSSLLRWVFLSFFIFLLSFLAHLRLSQQESHMRYARALGPTPTQEFSVHWEKRHLYNMF